MSWTLCTSGAAIAKAGVHANSTIVTSGATLAILSDMAEGFVCLECHNDFVTHYSSQQTQIKNAIAQAVSSIIAMDVIMYDPTGYLTREADMLMNNNYEMYSQSMKYLSIKQNQTLE